MSKNLDNTILFDVYSPLLTEKQRETLDLYYNEDLSLGEISEAAGITRQGVMNCIKKTEARLSELEEEMGIVKRFRTLSEKVEYLGELLGSEKLTAESEINRCLAEIKEQL